MSDDPPAAPDCSRRRTIKLSAIAAAGSTAALAGCGDEGPGEDDDQADHPDEVDDGDGGGGGPIDEEGPTGGGPEDGDGNGTTDADDT